MTAETSSPAFNAGAVALGLLTAVAYAAIVLVPIAQIGIAAFFGGLIGVFATASIAGRGFVLRLVVGLIAGFCAVYLSWFTWFWAYDSFDQALEVLSAGPFALIETLHLMLLTGFGYRISGEDLDGEMLRSVWIAESGLFALAALVGAIRGGR
ncbi:MAG: hypothetical protein AAGK00_20450 [Pseudomonadota bacterium]